MLSRTTTAFSIYLCFLGDNDIDRVATTIKLTATLSTKFDLFNIFKDFLNGESGPFNLLQLASTVTKIKFGYIAGSLESEYF